MSKRQLKKPLAVKGYTTQSDDDVERVNRHKESEERVLRMFEEMRTDRAYDQRAISLAVTHIQEAFMWANRAVFRPRRIMLPEDKSDVSGT